MKPPGLSNRVATRTQSESFNPGCSSLHDHVERVRPPVWPPEHTHIAPQRLTISNTVPLAAHFTTPCNAISYTIWFWGFRTSPYHQNVTHNNIATWQTGPPVCVERYIRPADVTVARNALLHPRMPQRALDQRGQPSESVYRRWCCGFRLVPNTHNIRDSRPTGSSRSEPKPTTSVNPTSGNMAINS